MANKTLYTTINYPQGVKVVFAKIDNEYELRADAGENAAVIMEILANSIREGASYDFIKQRVKPDNGFVMLFDRFERDDYSQVYAVYKYIKTL